MTPKEYLDEKVNAEETRLQFIRDSEEQFGMKHENLDKYDIFLIDEYVKFLDYLWEK